MLAGIWVEIAKHTFSPDNMRIRDKGGKIIHFLAAYAFVFAFANAAE